MGFIGVITHLLTFANFQRDIQVVLIFRLVKSSISPMSPTFTPPFPKTRSGGFGNPYLWWGPTKQGEE